MSRQVLTLPRKRAEITSAIPGIRVIGALVLCKSCHREWRAEIDPFGEVIVQTARCPSCSTKTPPAAA